MPQTNQLLAQNSLQDSLQDSFQQNSQPAFQSPRHVLSDILFYPQKKYQCGPAALATLLNSSLVSAPASSFIMSGKLAASDKLVTPEELVSQVYVPERKGSFQIEMIATARRYNLVPYVLRPKIYDIFKEIEAGNPVLVLLNLNFEWIPMWHYAVVVGYDLNKQQVILHSGVNEFITTDMHTFERTWSRAKYWAMVTLPTNELPATAQEFNYLKSASKFEKLNKLDIVLNAYKNALTKWPQSLTLHLAMGNAFYQLKQLNDAERILKKAVKLHPQSAIAHNNLAHVLLEQDKLQTAYNIAIKAVKLEGNSFGASEKTLEEIKMRLGKSRLKNSK